MPMGVETGEFIQVPAGYHGLKEPAMCQVRWVYSVTGKPVVVIDGPDGYPAFAPAEPKVAQADRKPGRLNAVA